MGKLFKIYFCNYATGEVIIRNAVYRTKRRAEYYTMVRMRNSGTINFGETYGIYAYEIREYDMTTPSLEEIKSIPIDICI